MKLAGGLLMIALLLFLGMHFSENLFESLEQLISPPSDEAIPTMTLEARPYRLRVPAQGELLGLRTTPVQTPRVRTGSLKISRLLPEGSLVEKGQVIVTFDPSDAELTLQESRNEFDTFYHRIEQTEGNSEGELTVLGMDREAAQKEAEYAEDQIRMDEQIFSRWEIQESVMSAALAEFREGTLVEKIDLQHSLADSDLKILSIDQQKAQTEIDLAEETLSSLAITAAESGVLIYTGWRMTELEVGTEVWPGQQLMEIAATDQFRARLQIPEQDISGIEEGQEVSVRVDAFPDRVLTGQVSQIARVAQQVNREDPRKYFEVDVLLATDAELLVRLKPGMELEAEIETRRDEEALVVAKSALFQEEDRWVVYLKEGEEFVKQQIEIVAGDHGFYVVKGLDPGSQVALTHPFEKEQLILPDFSAPRAPTGQERFVIFR